MFDHVKFGVSDYGASKAFFHRRRTARRRSHTGRGLRRTDVSRAKVLGVRGANAQVGRSPRSHRANGVMLRAPARLER